MVPTILVVGATGNTGQSVVRTLSTLLSTNSTSYRILALTRTATATVAQQLAQLPGVEVEEKNWPDITPDWLSQHGVERAFIASHSEPSQFVEESGFCLAALEAGVKYVVRISTAPSIVRPDSTAYYGRAHWALEALLGSPPFRGLQWTSLQPSTFSTAFLGSAAGAVQDFRKTGKQSTLRLIASKDGAVGIVDPNDVGTLAAHLLVAEDVSKHNQGKYILTGPEDITGEKIVKLVEEHIGAPVEEVIYSDVSFFDPETSARLKSALEAMWSGKRAGAKTSKEVLEVAAPMSTPADVFKMMLQE